MTMVRQFTETLYEVLTITARTAVMDIFCMVLSMNLIVFVS